MKQPSDEIGWNICTIQVILAKKGETDLALTIGIIALEHPENERNIGDFPLKPEAESLVEQLNKVLPAEEFQRAHFDASQVTLEGIEAIVSSRHLID